MSKILCVAAILVGIVAFSSAELTPLVSAARALLARASTTSEVLTLNITNLIILIILKMLIIGFGVFSFGGGAAVGRSSDRTSLSQSDLTGGMCFIMCASGFEQMCSCVRRSACEDDDVATQYLTAGKMWGKASKLTKLIPFNEKYERIMYDIQEAVEHKNNGGECSRYDWGFNQ